ncbi:HD-GYP domain-containing protein [Deinococcus apachensis]|uniref:HD-GYP domain-containing protein n=1 Tax=Deinococcus apachensis TaxID=309886 RepID=UPI00035C1811|nr:HD-GYP domain-containing protein [Deinococcus apachensis]
MAAPRLSLLFAATLGTTLVNLACLLALGPRGAAVQDALFVACCALCACTAAEAARLHPAPRNRAWTFVALAFGVSALGNACWTYLEYVRRETSTSSLADVAFLLVPGLLALAFLHLPHARPRGHDRVRLALDVSVLVGLLALWGWRLFIAPAVADLQEQSLAAALAALYPLLDMGLLCLLAWLVPQRLPSWPTLCFAAGTTGFVLGDVVYARLEASGGYVTGHPSDLLWAGGVVAFAAAAWCSVRNIPHDQAPPPRLELRPLSFVLPYLALAVSFLLHSLVPGGRPGELGTLAVLAGLVGLRQGLVWQDKTRLEAELRDAARLLEARVEERTVQVRQTFEGGLLALGMALEGRDLETSGHTERVVRLARALGRALHLPPEDLDALSQGAYLHDLGKLTVPDAILHKPGKLTPEEFAEMQTHAERGHRLALRLPHLAPGALTVILHHHERWDGTGYPHGLRGEGIPPLARIFAVADVYDALVSERPYKPAWTPQAAAAEILAGAGRHFDPCVVRAFAGLREAGRLGTPEEARDESTSLPAESPATAAPDRPGGPPPGRK